MAKTVVIDDMGWVARFPRQLRPYLTRLVFSLAAEHNWTVRQAGQRWRDDATPSTKPHHTTKDAMTDAEWAMLMGPQAS